MGRTQPDFASQRTTMHYEDWMRCGWKFKPPVPEGYKLLFSFRHFNTEGRDVLRVIEGDVDLWDGSPHEFSPEHIPWELKNRPELTVKPAFSGDQLPEPFISQSGEALFSFTSDESRTRPGGFVLEWTLQQMQPPDQPEPPAASSFAPDSFLLSWAAPRSSVPVAAYRLQVYPIGSPTDHPLAQSLEVLGDVLELRVGGLQPGSTYAFQLQAWTSSPIDTSSCINGENAACSLWSKAGNGTTGNLGQIWYVSPQGSYFYGDGSEATPYPMNIQELLERPDLVTGHQLMLLPGTYGDRFMRGAGRAQDFNLFGKMVTISSRDGPESTIFDCGGTSRFFTFNNSEAGVQISGVTVRNCGGHADGRGAVYITNKSSPVFDNCIFVENKAERGAAFVAEDGSNPIFRTTKFANNTALSGCPVTCTIALRSDDVCDADMCGSRACGYDYKGHCCPAACADAGANGICEGACSAPEVAAACGYDFGDCCPESTCVNTRADGTCDAACDNAECGFDGGDCGIDAGMSWGGVDLAEQLGFDGFSKGGTGLLTGGAHVKLIDCQVEDSAADLGGAFYVQGCDASRSRGASADAPCSDELLDGGVTTELEVQGGILATSSAHRGGLIYTDINAKLKLRGASLHGARAADQGGAVWAARSTVQMSGVKLSQHEATDGGAIYLADTELTASALDASDCTATSSGGFALLADASEATFAASNFSRNAAAHGGVARLVATAQAPLASGLVGTYAVTGVASATFDGGCVLTDNMASVAGGALAVSGLAPATGAVLKPSLSLEDAHLANSLCLSASGACFGGAISAELATLNVVGATLLDSNASDGGAIHASDTTLALSGLVVNRSHAATRGGVVSAVRSTMSLVDSYLHASEASGTEGGGSLYLSEVSATLQRVGFMGGQAARGGAVAAYACALLRMRSVTHPPFDPHVTRSNLQDESDCPRHSSPGGR